MNGHWYVIANQKSVKVLTEGPSRGRFKSVLVIENPLGGEKRSSLIRKKAGHGVKSLGRLGSVHYSENKRHDPLEDAANQFAREVSKELDSERLKKSFVSLTVVAEPHFLGKIRTSMRPDLKKTVVTWLKKDLLKTPNTELAKILLTKARD